MISKIFWVKFFTLISVILVLVVFTINFLIDPFSSREIVVDKRYKPVLNERNQKYHYIFNKENYKKYDCIILGSSRVMKIVPSNNVETKSCYNFGVHVANNAEKLFILEEWLKKGKLKKIYLGLEFYNFHKNKDQLYVNKVKFKNGTSGNYLSLSTLKLSLKSLLNMLKDEPQVYFEDDGSINYFNKDILIKNGKYDFSKKSFYIGSVGAIQNSYINDKFEIETKVFDVLKDIKRISNNEKIDLKVFITPQYEDLTKFIDTQKNLKDDFNTVREELKTIFPNIKDFSIQSSYNADTKNFYDPWHYRANYGDKIVHILDENQTLF